jgi:hypothetical protein
MGNEDGPADVQPFNIGEVDGMLMEKTRQELEQVRNCVSGLCEKLNDLLSHPTEEWNNIEEILTEFNQRLKGVSNVHARGPWSNFTEKLHQDDFKIETDLKKIENDAMQLLLTLESVGEHPHHKDFFDVFLHGVLQTLVQLKLSLIAMGKNSEEIKHEWSKVRESIDVARNNKEKTSLILEELWSSNLPVFIEGDETKRFREKQTQVLEALNQFSKTISLLQFGQATSLNLSDVNQHIITDASLPNKPVHGLPMWAKNAKKEHHMLEIYDQENWLGLKMETESIGCAGHEYKILYSDFFNFLESIGYQIMKRTSTMESQRVEPRYQTFSWNQEVIRFSTMEDVFLYHPHCPFSGHEMRIAMNAYFTHHGGGEIRWMVGQEVFNQVREFEGVSSHGSEAKELVEYIRTSFEQYQSQYGLLKNSKFSSDFVEILPKGRVFDQMVISVEKIEVLEDNVFSLLDNLERLKSQNIDTSRGILLAGPPGVGKSMTLDAIISQTACTAIFATTESLHNNIEGLFKLAQKYAPTVLVLEDIDALLISGQRDEHRSGVGMSALLNALDGIENNEGVITIATTNHPEHLDWALVNRPGRFDIRIDYAFPSREELRQILSLRLKSCNIEKNVNVDVLCDMFPRIGFTGSHIHDLIKQAHFISAKSSTEGEIILTQRALEKSIIRMVESHEKFLAERHISFKEASAIPNVDSFV